MSLLEVLPSRRYEAHFRWGVSRLITPKLWNFQRVLHTLAATQEVPWHTRLHSRGSTRVLPTSRGALFLPARSMEGSFTCVFGKKFPAFPSHLKRRRSPQERWEELQRRATIPRVPQMSQSIPGNLFSLHCRHFQAEDRLTPRWHVWQHFGKPCGKASCESLEGKPQIPWSTRREAWHCCYSSGGKRSCMPLLETRTDSPAETPEVPQDSRCHWRGILSFRHGLHTRS